MFSQEFLKNWMPLLVIGVGLLGAMLFAWYFLSGKDKTKRITGSILTILLTGFCVFCISLGVKRGIDLQGGASFIVQIQTPTQKIITPGDTPFKAGDEVNADALNAANKAIAQENRSTAAARAADPVNAPKEKVQAISENVGPLNYGALEFAQVIVDKRLNPNGTLDVVVTPQGTSNLYVEIPSDQPGGQKIDMGKAKESLEKVAKLEFYLLGDQGMGPVQKNEDGTWPVNPGFKVIPYRDLSPTDAAGKKLDEEARDKIKTDDLPRVFVRNKAEMGGKSVKDAFPYLAPGEVDYTIQVNLTSEYGEKMKAVTKPNIGKPLGIVLDGELLSAPTIQGELGETFVITGTFSEKEALDLANVLKNPLENPLKVLQSAEVSASYGADIVKQGIMSALMGLAATLLFMVIYYRLSGIIAVLALVVNLVLLLGLMQVFQFTLTMPGIAGIILTLGMAVDANVLIYERMREEFDTGKNFSTAVTASYEKAFSAIFDSNITTLITSFIMIMVASGAIRGFGISLTIGLIASMFSALLVTRVCFLWLSSTGLKRLNFLSLIKNRLIDFMGQRRRWLTLSAVLCGASLIIVGMKGSGALGYELKGGSTIALRGLSEAEVNGALKDFSVLVGKDSYNRGNLSIQTVNPIGGGSEYLNLRAPDGCDKAIIETLKAKLTPEKAALLDAPATKYSVEAMGAAVGGDMLKRSVIAILLGFLGIFIYTAFRFEFSFAVGALAALFHDVIIAVGACALFGKEIGLILIGAFLTIAGYSINDTIVIFDRVRENLRTQRGSLEEVLNLSISQTLSRTILTGTVTILSVLAMLIFGGKAMGDFSFAMLIGMISGIYSTIFIASPVVLWWSKLRKVDIRQQILDADAAKIEALSGIEREAPAKPGTLPDPEPTAGALPEPKP